MKKLNKKIFITGGTGFIGRYVVKELNKENYNLVVLTHQSSLEGEEFKNIEISQGDLSNKQNTKKIIEKFNPDILMHLAWEGITEGDFSLKRSLRNFKQGLNLLESLVKTNCKKVMFVGSDQEYGNCQGQLNENMPSLSQNPFTTAKNSLKDFGKEICKEIGADFYWPRVFYVYGPEQKKGLLHYIISNLNKGLEPNIKTPLTKNDFIYISDVVNALTGLLNKKTKGGVYNIGSGFSTNVKEIVRITYNLMGKNYEEIPTPQKEFSDRWADISKIKNEIGWEPKISFEEGIKKTIESF